MSKNTPIQTEPMPMPDVQNANFNSVSKKAISLDDISPVHKFAKWIQQRYKSVLDTPLDKNQKGFKKNIEEAYKEGYLNALQDSGIMLNNLCKVGKVM